MNLSDKQRDMILHASGLSTKKTHYRSYYNTEAIDPDWLDLVNKGLATGPCHVNTGIYSDGVGNFYLTDLGLDIAYGIKRRLKKP